MVDMNSDHVLVVPDTPDRIQQSTCPAFSSVARRDVDPSPSRGFRFKTRNNSMHGPSSQADALCVLPAHIDADNIFKQADVARALAFPEGSEAKLASQKERKTTGTILLNERRGEKHVSDQSCSTSNNISSNDAGRRRRSYQISDEEVGQQDANHQNANFFGVESILPTILVGEPQNRTGISIPNRLKAVADSDVCSGSRSEEVKDEMITNMIITGSSSPPSGVPQRHVGQKRLVRNGCISPSNVAKRSIRVDKRQEMISPSGVLHHQPPQHDVFGTANVIDLTDNSPAIKRHGNAVNISAKIVDTRATKRLRTDRAAEALVPASQYLANDSSCSGVSLSGRNNKGKETSHDMLDSNWIGEANSRSVCLSSAGTSAANNSSSCVNSEQGWRTTHNHTSKLPNSSMGKITNSSRQGSKSSAPFDLDHGSLEGNTSTSGATTIHTERFENRTIRIPRVRRKHALHSSHPGESSSALDEPNGSFLASSETTIGRISRYHTAHRHNIPVVTIDDVLPEVRPCSSGRTIGTSVDPTVQAQLESDELLARQLQEQLYNETPRVVPSEDDAVIAMSLQHEENAHRASRAVRRLQYNTRGAQRSRPNIFQNAVARTNNVISRLQNAGSVTLGLGAVSPRYSSAPHIQPNIDLNDYDALLALDENNHQHTGASETQINRLPQSVVQLNSIEEPCPVCLENPSVGDTIRHLPCFHKFHKECIDEWLRRKKLCPICKSGII